MSEPLKTDDLPVLELKEPESDSGPVLVPTPEPELVPHTEPLATLEPVVEVQVESVEATVLEAVAPVAEVQVESQADEAPAPTTQSAHKSEQDKILELASYADLFERLLDSAFLVNADDFKILAINPAAERILGVTYESFEGKTLADFIEEKDRDTYLQKLRKAKRSYYLFEFDAQWKHLEATGETKAQIMAFAACRLRLKNDQEILQITARDVTELREAQRRLKEMSVTDEMTKLPNFRRLKEMMTQEHERCARYGKEYAVIFCDVDNFKHYNDRNGHPAGDDLLRALAKVLMKAARNTDLPARYGGEEFVVLCTEVNWEGALIAAERIREAVASEKMPFSENQPLGCISVSIGVASFPADGDTVEKILHAADQALYVSKKSGRNRVTAHQKMPEVQAEPPAPKVTPPPFKRRAAP